MTTWKSRYTTETDLKKDVIERLTRARKEGVSSGVIAKESSKGMSIHVIYDMLEAKAYPAEIWSMVDKGLRKLGY